MKFEFPLQIFENYQMSNLMKIGPVGAELIHVEIRTDMTKLTVICRSFAQAPINGVRVDCIQRVEDTVSGASCKHSN